MAGLEAAHAGKCDAGEERTYKEREGRRHCMKDYEAVCKEERGDSLYNYQQR